MPMEQARHTLNHLCACACVYTGACVCVYIQVRVLVCVYQESKEDVSVYAVLVPCINVSCPCNTRVSMSHVPATHLTHPQPPVCVCVWGGWGMHNSVGRWAGDWCVCARACKCTRLLRVCVCSTVRACVRVNTWDLHSFKHLL
jgi:hypothetical protein